MSYLAALDAGVIINGGGGTTPSLSEVMAVGATASANLDMDNFTIENCDSITNSNTILLINSTNNLQLQSQAIINVVSPLLNIDINGDIGTAGQVLTSTGSTLTGLEWTSIGAGVNILPLNNTFTGTNTFTAGVNILSDYGLAQNIIPARLSGYVGNAVVSGSSAIIPDTDPYSSKYIFQSSLNSVTMPTASKGKSLTILNYNQSVNITLYSKSTGYPVNFILINGGTVANTSVIYPYYAYTFYCLDNSDGSWIAYR